MLNGALPPPQGPQAPPSTPHAPAPSRMSPQQPLEAATDANIPRLHLWSLASLWSATSNPSSASLLSPTGLPSRNDNHNNLVALQSQPSTSSSGSGSTVSTASLRAGGTPLGWQQRFTSAAGASVVSAVVVNPLDVVKTRMQLQAASPELARAMAHRIEPLSEMWAITSCPLCVPRGSAATMAADPHLYTGTMDGMRKIVQFEGVTALYRGTSASLLMAVPMVGIYFPLYDALLARLQSLGGPLAPYSPLMAGIAARTAAVLCTSPLELIRTRMQAAMHHHSDHPGGRVSSMWQHLPMVADQRMSTRVRNLWTGVGATLARDVPFSAIYWQMLEPLRTALLPLDRSSASQSQVIYANLIAGSTAGAVAAAATTPLDVVKTRAQLHPGMGASSESAAGIMDSLRQIARSGGIKALFTGVGPRAVRAAPACAIVVSSYEAIKSLYGQ